MCSEFVWISKIDQKKENVISDKFHWLIFGAELYRVRLNATLTFMPNLFQLHVWFSSNFYNIQWWIQDVPNGSAQTHEFGAKIRHLARCMPAGYSIGLSTMTLTGPPCRCPSQWILSLWRAIPLPWKIGRRPPDPVELKNIKFLLHKSAK